MSSEGERKGQPRKPNFELSAEDLRSVVAFTSAAAEVVLPHFEMRCPEDGRPRQALTAALAFVHGAPRSRAQRVSAPAAHRAGREAASEIAFHAAMAAGDAAASAYLHPLADPVQVKHILRAPAHAVRVIELTDSPDRDVDLSPLLERFASYATSQLRDVLRRYPRISATSSRTTEKSSLNNDRTNPINRSIYELDARLRNGPTAATEQR
ncbi:putative immunity protein [Brevibacterium sp. 239c]|uniref:putative immunity protein n=1 Tax=Brevibacterium sp. 239c TaxID=1965356 RepID=UPI000C7696D1